MTCEKTISLSQQVELFFSMVNDIKSVLAIARGKGIAMRSRSKPLRLFYFVRNKNCHFWLAMALENLFVKECEKNKAN